MTRFSFFSLFFIFAAITLLWTACNKDRGLSDGSMPQSYATDRNSDYTQAELDEIAQAIADIQAFKAQIDRWRDGQELSQTMAADEAAEKVEVAINFYLSKPGLSFAEYTAVFDSVSVSATGATWTGADVAAFYNAMKARLSVHFDAVSGTDKAYQFVDMGLPIVKDGVSKVYFVANIGKGEITEPMSITDLEVRWAIEDLGFTNPTPCAGNAAGIIGQAVNANLGFFLKNLAPAPINAGNPLANPKVVIVGTIQNVQTNFLGARFPLGNSPDPLFIVSSAFKTPAFVGNFLSNDEDKGPIAGNSAPGFPIRGEFKVHADFAFTPNLPDENCFSLTKLGTYILSNREVGDFYVPEVNKPVFNGGFTGKRRLLSTYVVGAAQKGETGFDDVFVYRQEHATWHFCARVLPVILTDPGQLCCPGDL